MSRGGAVPEAAGDKVDLARLSAVTQTQARKTDDTAGTIETAHHTRVSMHNNRALMIFYFKYIFFLALVGLYYGLVSYVTDNNLSNISNFSSAVVYANRRYPSLQLSLAAAAWNALYDYDDMKLNDPNNGLLRGGNFLTFADTLYKDAAEVQQSLLFGGMGIPRVESPEQDALLYTSPCLLDPQRIDELGIWVDKYFWDNCYTIDNGVFAKTGMVGMWMSMMDTLATLIQPQYTKALHHLVANTAVTPAVSATAADILARIQKTDEYLNYYLEPLLALSAAMYYEYAYDSITLFSTARKILVGVYCAVVAVYFLLVLRPSGRALYDAAIKTKSLLLLLPHGVVVDSVQKYIQKHAIEDS